MKLDSRYADFFPEYSNYFGRDLILLKSMYGMNNYGKLSADKLTEWLLEAGFVQYQCQMSMLGEVKNERWTDARTCDRLGGAHTCDRYPLG